MMHLNLSDKEELYMMLRAMGCSFSTNQSKNRKYLVVGWSPDKDNLEAVKMKVKYYFSSSYVTNQTAERVIFRINPETY